MTVALSCAELEIKYSKKYHMVRFFERKNISKAIKKSRAELEGLEAGDKKRKEVAKRIAELEDDLECASPR